MTIDTKSFAPPLFDGDNDLFARRVGSASRPQTVERTGEPMPMPVQMACPNPECDASYTVADENLGRIGRCKKCGTKFPLVPGTRVEAPEAYTPDDLDSIPKPADPVLPESFGRYKVVRLLGRGGMGSVYLTLDTQLKRQVALKVPHIHAFADRPDVRERFFREAQAAARFHHPNFCPIYDIGEVDGVPYLTMAFIEGKTLAASIEWGSGWPPRRAVEVTRELALALAKAHREGIVHRDLKPANIMVDASGGLVLMDFGLARWYDDLDSTFTPTGAILGTPAYMPPEQAEGNIKAIGPRSDLYSLGVILYELLTGRRPFEGPITKVLGMIAFVDPPPPSTHRPDLDPRLEAICLKAMAKKPDDRHASMDEFAAALKSWLDEDFAPRVPDSKDAGDVADVGPPDPPPLMIPEDDPPTQVPPPNVWLDAHRTKPAEPKPVPTLEPEPIGSVADEIPELDFRPEVVPRKGRVILPLVALLAMETLVRLASLLSLHEHQNFRNGIEAVYSRIGAVVLASFFAVLWGFRSDRSSVRNLIAFLMIGECSVLAVSASMDGDYSTLLIFAFAFLISTFANGIYPSIVRLMVDRVSTNRLGTTFGIMWAVVALVDQFAPKSVSNNAQSEQWISHYCLVVAAIGAMYGLGFWLRFRDANGSGTTADAGGEPTLTSESRSGGSTGFYKSPKSLWFRSGNVWALCLMYASWQVGISCLFRTEFARLGRQGEFFHSVLPTVFEALGCVVGGIWSDSIFRRTANLRRARRGIGLSGMMMAGSGIAASPVIGDQGSWVLVILTLLLARFGVGFATGPTWAAMIDVGGQRSGTLCGLMLVGGIILPRSINFLFMSPSVALLSDVVCLGGFFLAAACWMRIDASHKIEYVGK
jgi:serine/threonine protein kinase